MTIGDRIIHLRKKHNLSREKLAKSLDISYWALSKYEKSTRTPDPDILDKIANYFGTSVDYLYGRSEVEDILISWRNKIQNGERIILKGVLLTEEHIDKMENAITKTDD